MDYNAIYTEITLEMTAYCKSYPKDISTKPYTCLEYFARCGKLFELNNKLVNLINLADKTDNQKNLAQLDKEIDEIRTEILKITQTRGK